MAFTSLSNNAPLERLWIIWQPRNIILRNTRATIVLGGSQLTRCIPLSKREAEIKNQAGFFVFDKFSLQVNSWRRIWWRVNQPFKHTFSQHVSGKQYYEALFYHTDLGQNLFFFCPIILQFFTILQDNLHSFNIHDVKARASFAKQIIALNYQTFSWKEFHNAGLFR